MSDEEVKTKVFAELSAEDGVSLQALAPKYNVPYATLLEWRKEHETQIVPDSQVVMPLHTMAASIALAAEDELRLLEQDVKELNGSDLDKLDEAVKQAAVTLAVKIKRLAADTNEPVEISRLAVSLAGIQNAFFNKPGVNVQINDLRGATMVNMFKARLVN